MTRFDPAFIFPLNLGSHPKYVAEAASHEVGHRLGLHHDGPGYYPGHGNWAPIMGVGASAWACKGGGARVCRGGVGAGQASVAVGAGTSNYP